MLLYHRNVGQILEYSAASNRHLRPLSNGNTLAELPKDYIFLAEMFADLTVVCCSRYYNDAKLKVAELGLPDYESLADLFFNISQKQQNSLLRKLLFDFKIFTNHFYKR